jgi:16S rRNA (uracil1498-N3)-methyltransferase
MGSCGSKIIGDFMNRFFVDSSDIYDNEIILKDKEDINHIIKVLRLNNEDEIIVCDGLGNDFKVKIEKVEKNLIKLKKIETYVNENESNIKVTLFQGIPKSAKIELVIQKATELGVTQIIPVITNRTIVKFENHRVMDNKTERWQKVAKEACKQCNRGIIPKVNSPINFNEALTLAKELDLVILPYEKENSKNLKSIFKYKKDIKSVGIIIGPEGGFTSEEVSFAAENNFDIVTLGSRILRTETAGLAVLSILMYELGDIS